MQVVRKSDFPYVEQREVSHQGFRFIRPVERVINIFPKDALVFFQFLSRFSTLFELFGDNYEKSLSINLSVSIEFFQPRKTRIMLCTMNEEQRKNGADSEEMYDYSYVDATARIALYDDMKSAPRITEIGPAPTAEFIENLTTTVWEQAKLVGGNLPYTLIREVSENFIHAQFREIVVSILDGGNTIRFADQGPGIKEKDNARKPGFSSAIEPMKKYIRGVGSGLPIVQDYLDSSEGTIVMEDNLTTGSVITITLESKYSRKEERKATSQPVPLNIPLSDREKFFLTILMREGDLGITDIGKIAETASSTTFNTLKKLEEAGLVQKIGKKRSLTPFGESVASSL